MFNAVVRVPGALVDGVQVKVSQKGAYAGQKYAVVRFSDEQGNRSEAIDRDASRVDTWARGIFDLTLHVREGHSAQRNESWINVSVVDAVRVGDIAGAVAPAPAPETPPGVDMTALAAAVAQVLAQQQGADALSA